MKNKFSKGGIYEMNFNSIIYSSYIAQSCILAKIDVEASGSFTEIDNILRNYISQIGAVKYNTVIGISNIVILLICFAIRFKIYYDSADLDKDNKELCKRYRHYIFNHICICFVFAFIISFLGIIIINSSINIVWNFLVAPLLGFLVSIIFENEVLTKFEEKYTILDNPLHENKDSEGGDDDKKEKQSATIGNDTNNINININNGTDNDIDTDEKFVLKSDDTLSDEEKIEATFNRLIDCQKEQSVLLEKHTVELENQSQTLNDLQALMKNMIRFELEDMIYSCLNKGYATPAEDKRIRIKYKDYRANKGNGDIEELYEKRYIKLKMHEE